MQWLDALGKFVLGLLKPYFALSLVYIFSCSHFNSFGYRNSKSLIGL